MSNMDMPLDWREAVQRWNFGDVRQWPRDAPGAISHHVLPEMLLAGYAQGVFPWYEETSAPLWWSPDPRAVLFPEHFHRSRRLMRRLRSGRFRFTHNLAFEAVVRCAAQVPRKGQQGTWITAEMQQAYMALHEAGWGMSFEVWEQGKLVGGLFGVRLGAAFFAESMFSLVSDGSKMAMAHMMNMAQSQRWQFVDCQFLTPHLARLGAVAIPRARYLAQLQRALDEVTINGK